MSNKTKENNFTELDETYNTLTKEILDSDLSKETILAVTTEIKDWLDKLTAIKARLAA